VCRSALLPRKRAAQPDTSAPSSSAPTMEAFPVIRLERPKAPPRPAVCAREAIVQVPTDSRRAERRQERGKGRRPATARRSSAVSRDRASWRNPESDFEGLDGEIGSPKRPMSRGECRHHAGCRSPRRPSAREQDHGDSPPRAGRSSSTIALALRIDLRNCAASTGRVGGGSGPASHSGID
jgi:hypothetical protein